MAPGALALFLGRTRSGACRDKSAGEADPHPTSCLSPGSVLCGQSGAHQGLEVTCGLAAPRCVEGAHNSQKPKAGAPLCSAAEAAVQEAIAGCTGWCLERCPTIPRRLPTSSDGPSGKVGRVSCTESLAAVCYPLGQRRRYPGPARQGTHKALTCPAGGGEAAAGEDPRRGAQPAGTIAAGRPAVRARAAQSPRGRAPRDARWPAAAGSGPTWAPRANTKRFLLLQSKSGPAGSRPETARRGDAGLGLGARKGRDPCPPAPPHCLGPTEGW
ncbi:protein bassoon-like [Cavia porcellus]|uniref:protein bassoon-like n=1 Tax=Cavia porcellus TaxID=10141 RepID=UPI002FE3BF25